MARTLLLEVVTPESIVYTGEVEMAVVPTVDGDIGILPLHAPLVGVLKAGEVRVKIGDTTIWFAVSGGYVQVHEDKVIVLADDAMPASQIDVESARLAVSDIQARLAEVGALSEEAGSLQHDLQWAAVQVKVGDAAR
jgi:F-type H+-transporting ATPase subunit epsilon